MKDYSLLFSFPLWVKDSPPPAFPQGCVHRTPLFIYVSFLSLCLRLMLCYVSILRHIFMFNCQRIYLCTFCIPVYQYNFFPLMRKDLFLALFKAFKDAKIIFSSFILLPHKRIYNLFISYKFFVIILIHINMHFF